jgi:hypothetical protein
MPLSLNSAGIPWSYFGDGGPGEYPIQIGRDIFNAVSLTGLNRSPVDDLVSYTLGGLRVAGDPVLPVETMAYAFVVDGSAVIVGAETGAPYLMENAYCPDENTIIQYHRDKHGCLKLVAECEDMERVHAEPLTSVWRLTAAGWVETVFEYTQSEIKVSTGVTKKKNELTAIPNGRGILYWAQHVWHRLEELRGQWREVLMGAGKTILSGDGVGDEDSVRQAANSAKRLMAFPGQVQVDRVTSTAEADMLNSEYASLKEDWLAALNAMEQDTPNRPVASDRELRMAAMLQFVRRVRGKLTEFYEPYGVTLTFDRLVVTSPDDRIKEMDIIDRAGLPAAEAAELRRNLVK